MTTPASQKSSNGELCFDLYFAKADFFSLSLTALFDSSRKDFISGILSKALLASPVLTLLVEDDVDSIILFLIVTFPFELPDLFVVMLSLLEGVAGVEGLFESGRVVVVVT